MQRWLPIGTLLVLAVGAAVLLMRPGPVDATASHGPTADRARKAQRPQLAATPPSAPRLSATVGNTEGDGSPELTRPEGEPGRPAPPRTVDAPEERKGPEDAVSAWPATAQGIQGAVREVVGEIRDCYHSALDEVPDLQGDLKIRMVIDEEAGVGRISEVGVTAGLLEDAPMEDCVLDALEVLQFDPPSEGRLEVTYPFRFRLE